MGISLQDNADNGLYICVCVCVGVKRIVVPKTSLQVYSNFETKLYNVHVVMHVHLLVTPAQLMRPDIG